MDQLIKELDIKLKALLESLRQEIGGIRTNRPSPQLVEDIQVEYLGEKLKVKQLGSISVNPPREIVITAWDKGALASIAKAIQESSLKLNPAVDGGVVRLNMPVLTEERREELGRVVKSTAEKSRIKLRALRDEVNKKIETDFKAKTINEDQKFKTKKRVQEAVDKVNIEIEGMVGKKVKEIAE